MLDGQTLEHRHPEGMCALATLQQPELRMQAVEEVEANTAEQWWEVPTKCRAE